MKNLEEVDNFSKRMLTMKVSILPRLFGSNQEDDNKATSEGNGHISNPTILATVLKNIMKMKNIRNIAIQISKYTREYLN
jgi:hypothetical protein